MDSYEMSSEDYQADYRNLIDIKEKLEKEIKSLKEENLKQQEDTSKKVDNLKQTIEKNKKNYQHSIDALKGGIEVTNLKQTIEENKKSYEQSLDALGGVEVDDYSKLSEPILYYEATKRMIEDFKPKTNRRWKRLTYDLFNICEQSVRDQTRLGLSIKQKDVIDNWLVRNG